MCIIRVVPIEVTMAILILTLLALPIGNFRLITAYVRMKEKLMLLIANRAASDLLVTVIEIPHLVTTEVTVCYAFFVDGVFASFLRKMCSFLDDISPSV